MTWPLPALPTTLAATTVLATAGHLSSATQQTELFHQEPIARSSRSRSMAEETTGPSREKQGRGATIRSSPTSLS